MTWAAIGAAAVTVVGTYVTKDSGGGSSSSGSSDTQRNMQAADPFASQRFQYQSALARLMGMPSGYNAFTQSTNPSQGMATPQGGADSYQGATGPNGTQWSGIGSGSGYIYRPGITGPQSQPTSPGSVVSSTVGGATGGIFDPMYGKSGADFVSSDPSYGFRLQSGSEAVQRAMGSKGMNGSGNMMAALMQYGQGLASTEYQNDFLRSETAFQNNFNNLALLSGATSGSPGAAGQLGLQGQQMQQGNDAATLAQWNQWLQPAAKAAGNWLNSNGNSGVGPGGSGTGSSGGGDAGAGSSGGGASSSDPFANASYTL